MQIKSKTKKNNSLNIYILLDYYLDHILVLINVHSHCIPNVYLICTPICVICGV